MADSTWGKVMNVCIFCSASELPEKYTHAAREFATGLALRGHTLVWGGSNRGMMKVIADAARDAGGRIVGISTELLRAQARDDADEMLVMPTLAERKAKLLERADAIVVLPGGLGTLDEITEVLELKKHNLHDKPIVFLNTEGFYEGLHQQLGRMDREGFLPRALEGLLHFAATPDEALAHLHSP